MYICTFPSDILQLDEKQLRLLSNYSKALQILYIRHPRMTRNYNPSPIILSSSHSSPRNGPNS